MSPRNPLRAALVLSLLPMAPMRAADGELDTSFDTDGKVTVGFDLGQGNHDNGKAVAQFPDGRVAIVGSVDRVLSGDVDFGIALFGANGAPDTGYSTDGRTQVFYDLGTHRADRGQAIVAMKDGRVVTCGTAQYDHDATYDDRLVVSRTLAGGGADTTFGPASNGKVVLVPFGLTDSDASECNAAIVLPDDRIVVPFANWNYHQTGLIRLEADGDLDPTFGGDGISEMPACSSDLDSCEFRRVLLLPDGKYMAVGTKMVELAKNFYGSQLFLARYTSAGLLDNSFSGDGLAIVHAPSPQAIADFPVEAALDPSGRVVVIDHVQEGVSSYYLLTRIGSNGVVDGTFGFGGWSQLELRSPAAAQQEITGLAIQGDGKILVSGDFQFNASDWDCAAMRLNPVATALDSSFDGDGRRSIAFDLGDTADTDLCFDLAIGDGRPVLAGAVMVGTSYDFAALRLKNDYVFIDGFESQSTFFWSGQIP